MERKRRHDLAKLLTRLPPHQKLWLEEQAQRNLTSMNAEIVRAIQFRMNNEPPQSTIG